MTARRRERKLVADRAGRVARRLRELDRLRSEAKADNREDRTEVEQLEQALAIERAARERAEEADRRKDAFLAILSHEMRSPLNSVLTWVQVLRSERLAIETRRQALDSIERSAKLQTRMIEDLLDNSRIIAGKLSLEPQHCDLATILRAAVDVALSAAREKEIDLRCTLETDHVPLRADPVRLQQVVGNLLSNAIKFTPARGRITVELSRRGESAEVRVGDTGCGIAKDILPHVFDSFRQGDSSITRRHSGLGLGLAIARHLVELHGGAIEATSDGVDRGSTFTVRLPLNRQAPQPAGGAPDLDRATAMIRGLSVIVVDDDLDSARALELVLGAAGATVRRAGSAAEALRLCDEDAYAIVISDLAMPEQDGYALLRALRERGIDVPVIAFTASASTADRARVREAGFCLHLTKPIEPDDLLEAVAMAAAGRAEDFARERLTPPR